MPIVVGLIALGLLIYGAIWSFNALHAQFGLGVAVGVAIVVLLAIAAGVMRWLASRREIAPNLRRGEHGDWTHELATDWGGVRIAAGKRLCDVRLRGETGSYIFADLRGARAQEAGGAWQVLLDVKDAKRAEWTLPMRDRNEAHKWARILSLATQQKL
ncbi:MULTISPECIES: hypothetical protein [Caballeronia]|uniref:Uncharacterized protein n=1 Tax=Caballeronia cordobensis TaxID=1353886 RepID=A0A158IJQ5_CABCO|nr:MULTISPECIES: hypothetical protein [Caballeronia]MCE4541296.1 hypothetical protein [Caballeronia sp. PC1]MCE4569661.1 hypothetical protein [Caballeronia sp. CLC5]BAO86909.1 putative signal peptide transmembrane protein [Burkholderia sp. RPE67]SAL56489.1 hypothetical protein AWB70_04911 [Caballeronia cordobensis]